MAQPPPAEQAPGTRPHEALLHGTCVAPGLAMGVSQRKDYEFLRTPPRRVPRDRVEHELNRFHRALEVSHDQLADLKRRIQGLVPADHARILDTHVAYLRDSVFLSDVENLILEEQMSLEAAIGKVIADFDRIFRLVENELLRDRAVDLRDVGIRVLRNLELQSEEGRARPEGPRRYVLVARELSIVDMFNLENERVLGIVTEEGGLTSHAAILARSMRIPTLTGVPKLLESVREGDFLIVDATEGVVHVEPDEVVRSQYLGSGGREGRSAAPRPIELPLRTADGEEVRLASSCGNLPEVEQAQALGVGRVGLYRTELLYLLGKEEPSLDSLIAHYRAVVGHAQGEPVSFRLLCADSSLGLPWLHELREPNPALGRAGIRALLEREQVLRRQLQALIAVAREQGEVRIALPFVIDCGELRRVREICFEELRLADARSAPALRLGAIVETPAAALGVRALAAESDFLVLSLDALIQYLLAADREQHELGEHFEPLHPVVLRCVADVAQAAAEAGKELSVFGVCAASRLNLPLLLGAGLRDLCAAPVQLEEVAAAVRATRIDRARELVERATRAACRADLLALVDRMLHD